MKKNENNSARQIYVVLSVMIVAMLIALSVRFYKGNQTSTAPETEQVVQQEQEIVSEATEVVVEALESLGIDSSNTVAAPETNNILVLEFEGFKLGSR